MPKTKLVRIVEPKKKREPTIEELEEVDLEDDEPTEEEQEAIGKIADFQSKFSGKQYKIRIERFNVTEAEWEWVTRLPLEGFDAFNVLPKYGGGKYKAVLMDEGGRYVKGGIVEFRFSTPAEPVPDKPRSAMDDPAVVLLIESMKQQSMMLMDVLKTSLPAQAANAPKGMDAAQMFDMFAKFSALTAPKENNMKSFMEMMNLWEKMKDTFTPEEKESGGIVSEIKEAMGALALLPQIRAQIPNAPSMPTGPQMISPTTPMTVTTREPKKVKDAKPISQSGQKALFYVPKFEDAARENQPVEKWADKLLEILDEEVIPALVKEYNGFVSADSIYDRLLEGAKSDEKEIIFIHAPALLPYKEWTYRVIEEAVKILESPDTEEIPDTRESL